jgi:hypothetical protein
LQTLDCIAELLAESWIVVDFAFKDQQRRGRALLPAMAERTMEHVFDRLVAIGKGRHDRGVLAARLGKKIHGRLVAQHLGRRVGAAREDDRVDAVMRDQSLADGAAAARRELQGRLRHARPPKTLAQ